MTFAETKKPDLGGPFWVLSLQQTLVASLLYSIIMSGVLVNKANGYGPGLISAASIVYALYSMRRFERHFAWERLSFQELMGKAQVDPMCKMKQKTFDGEYEQPELTFK